MNPLKRLSAKPFVSWLLVLVYASMIFYFSSIPGKIIPPAVPAYSTLLHALEYFGFGLLLLPAVKSTGRGRYFILAFIALALYAASDEVHQFFVPGRVMSLLDWLSDCVGGLFGLFLCERSLD
jgi:VanZ family protein